MSLKSDTVSNFYNLAFNEQDPIPPLPHAISIMYHILYCKELARCWLSVSQIEISKSNWSRPIG